MGRQYPPVAPRTQKQRGSAGRSPGFFGPFRWMGWRGSVSGLRAPGTQAGTSSARLATAPLLQGSALARLPQSPSPDCALSLCRPS